LKNAELELYGQDQGGIYNDTFSGEDAGGWSRNQVKWDSLMGSSTYERTVRALQLYKEGKGQYPFRRVLEESGEDDPQAVMQEGIAEAKADMQRQQAMQPPGGPGGGAESPPAGPPGGGGPQSAAHDAMSLGAGGSGGPPSAPPAPVQPQPPQSPDAPTAPPAGGAGMPGFGPVASAPTQKGLGHPAPLPNFGKDIDMVVAGLQLQGTVLQSFPTKTGVHVDISDEGGKSTADVHTLKVALAPLAKEIAGPTGKVDVKITKGS
jgi:hypothetical protein